MFQRLGNRKKMQETINIVNTITKGIKKKKRISKQINSTITEIKNTLEETSSRITEAEERISELEDRMVEITAEEHDKGKRMKIIEDSFRDMWDNIKHTNI